MCANFVITFAIVAVIVMTSCAVIVLICLERINLSSLAVFVIAVVFSFHLIFVITCSNKKRFCEGNATSTTFACVSGKTLPNRASIAFLIKSCLNSVAFFDQLQCLFPQDFKSRYGVTIVLLFFQFCASRQKCILMSFDAQ